jgi:hypothetical protein
LRVFRILALAGIVLLSLLFLDMPARSANGQPTQDQGLVGLINSYRTANGLGPLASSPALSSAAAWKAQDMAANNYIGHVDSLGRSPGQLMTVMGYAYNVWKGENLAAGSTAAAEVLQLWQNSPPHNAILLSPNYVAIGVAHAYSGASDYFWYWAAEFGGFDDTVAPITPEPPPPPASAESEPAEPATTPQPAFPPAFSGADFPQTLPGNQGLTPGSESRLAGETGLAVLQPLLIFGTRLSALVQFEGAQPIRLSRSATTLTWKDTSAYFHLLFELIQIARDRQI